jgi:TonB family protein
MGSSASGLRPTTERKGSHLAIDLANANSSASGGKLTVCLEDALYARLALPEATRGILLGFEEEGTIRLTSCRALTGETAAELVASLTSFHRARQGARAEVQSEILGFFSTFASEKGSLAALEEELLNHEMAAQCRVVIQRHLAKSEYWIRADRQSANFLFTWVDPQNNAWSPNQAPVADTLATLSAATQMFKTDNVLANTAEPVEKTKTPMILMAAGALVALGAGAYFLMGRDSGQKAASIEISELGTSEISTSQVVAPTTSVAAETTKQMTPEQQKQLQDQQQLWLRQQQELLLRQQQAEAAAAAAKRNIKGVDLSQLKRSGPGSQAQLDEPTPTASLGIPTNRMSPNIGGQINAAPPPPKAVVAPPPVAAAPVAAVVTPPRTKTRSGLSVPPTIMKTLPNAATVTVAIRVDANGNVLSAVPQGKSAGVTDFAASYIASTVRNWAFNPATSNGQPVAGSTTVQVTVKRPN